MDVSVIGISVLYLDLEMEDNFIDSFFSIPSFHHSLSFTDIISFSACRGAMCRRPGGGVIGGGPGGGGIGGVGGVSDGLVPKANEIIRKITNIDNNIDTPVTIAGAA